MYLVKFILFAVIISQIFGAFGHFPFGSSQSAIYLGDVLLIFDLLFFMTWCIVTKRKVQYPSNFKLIVYFWGSCLISLVSSFFLFPAVSVLMGSLYLLRFIIYSLTFLITYNLHKSNVLKTDELITVWVNVGLVTLALGFLQLIFYPNLELLTEFGFDPHNGRLTSTFLDPNFAGVALILTLGLCLYKLLNGTKQKIYWVSVCGVLGLAVILTFSRSAYMMLLISFTYISIRKFKKLLVVLVIAGTMTFSLSSRFAERVKGGLTFDKTSQERVISWQNGIKVFQLNPIFGVGFNNLKTAQTKLNLFPVFSQEGGHSGSGVDSSLILVLATTGLVGLVTYSSFWIKTLLGLAKGKGILSIVIFGLVVSLLINSQFINSLFFPSIMLWYFTFLGVTH